MGNIKEYNKTILQTSFTSLEAIYYLTQVVKQNQPMTSANGKDSIFPVARARISQERGGEWSEEKRDTHAELTLREMRFIRYIDKEETTFEVSDIGNEFLDSFELTETSTEDGKVKLSLVDKLSLDEKNQLLLDILIRITVIQEKYGRKIRPYLILFKLLTEPELGGYITKSEWAYFINNPCYLTDEQYQTIKRDVVSIRKTEEVVELKKSDRILTRLVLWNVLDRIDIPNESKSCFGFNDDFSKAVGINMLRGENCNIFDNTEKSLVEDYDFVERLHGGSNTILYGVPGCGKSWTIEHEYCKNDSKVKRLVFHPEYSNADFIGQILPVLDKNKMVRYEFVPGPFTTILKDAYVNPLQKFILIIEEINRGNAPAIFGEMFQLLDRLEKDKDNYPQGTSEYGISQSSMAEYIYGKSSHEIRIPSNLSIIATMNTADQNVFTLDTAFKRRWKMVSIPNDFENCDNKNEKIGGTVITWIEFAEEVNKLIVNESSSSVSSEDKRLGAYFATKEQLKDSKMFSEKVLAYLWDDVFRYDRGILFDTKNISTLEELIKVFEKDGLKVFNSKILDTFNTKENDVEIK